MAFPDLLYPKEFPGIQPGVVLMGKGDLITKPFPYSILLPPHHSISLTVPVSDYWGSAFKQIAGGKYEGGIHLRSNVAQSKQDILGWYMKDPHTLIVELDNMSEDSMTIDRDQSISLGNPYCFKSPIEGDALSEQVGQMSFSENGQPRIIWKNQASSYGFDPNDPLMPTGDSIELPLIKAHPPIGRPGGREISIAHLPSGPHRGLLHEMIEIDTDGVSIDKNLTDTYQSPIQLTSTAPLSMPSDTALVLWGCVKEHGGKKYIVPHSASNVIRGAAIAGGTSGVLEGEIYTHSIMVESHNRILTDIYPSSVLCKAFRIQVV